MTPKVESSSAAKIARDYASKVVTGKISACNLHKLACQRHLIDLKEAKHRGYYFSPKAAQHAVDFFQRFLRHSKGQWAGRTFTLEPWQIFSLSVEFGWLREKDGLRRFRQALNEYPRKNGKSTLSAGKGLYMLIADGEGGAEVYSAATKAEQARIIWAEAAKMVKASPALSKVCKCYHSTISVLATNSKFAPLASDSKKMDGLNVHCALIDEIHAHRNRGVYDILDTATGARTQPLIDITTTAGSDRHSIGYEVHDYAVKVLTGVVQDDTFFAFITSIDQGDDWRDPEIHRKANPNYGVSVNPTDLMDKCRKAIDVRSYENTFKRFHLNVWTEQAVKWLNIERWDACGEMFDHDSLKGQTCYAGLDLSSTLDITAFVTVFERNGDTLIIPKFWIPEENARERAIVDRVPYDQWVRDGFMTATPGNIIDYDFIRRDINEMCELYDVKEIALDRWNATQLALQLQGDGRNIVPFGQGFQSMSAPSKELEALVFGKRIYHNANPVLRWMAANVAIQSDPTDRIKPVKDKSTGRIDGIVALIMALGARAAAPVDDAFIYNDHGIYIA